MIGEVRAYAANRLPDGWLSCDGQFLPITQYQALYKVIGTRFGGSGSSFQLPDLNGAVAMGVSQTHDLGSSGGEAAVTLAPAQLARHGHALGAGTLDPADAKTVSARSLYGVNVGGAMYQSKADTTMHPAALSPAGAGNPHENRMPFLAVVYAIAATGAFVAPSG